MSIQPAQTPVPQSETTPTTSNQNPHRNSSGKPPIIGFCAAGLVGSFFLPWIGNVSGFDLAKIDNQFYFFWSIPVFSGFTILAGLIKRGQKNIAFITGALPFVVLAVCLNYIGHDLLRILAVGAYSGLALGLVMLIASRRFN